VINLQAHASAVDCMFYENDKVPVKTPSASDDYHKESPSTRTDTISTVSTQASSFDLHVSSLSEVRTISSFGSEENIPSECGKYSTAPLNMLPGDFSDEPRAPLRERRGLAPMQVVTTNLRPKGQVDKIAAPERGQELRGSSQLTTAKNQRRIDLNGSCLCVGQCCCPSAQVKPSAIILGEQTSSGNKLSESTFSGRLSDSDLESNESHEDLALTPSTGHGCVLDDDVVQFCLLEAIINALPR